MNNKKKMIVTTTIIMILCFFISPIQTFATESNNRVINEFMLKFNLTNQALRVEPKQVYNINTINKYLKLTQGFDKINTPTFSSQKFIAGEGYQQTEVGILVYTIDKKSNSIRLLTSPKYQIIGASGIFTHMLNFYLTGENHILIAVNYNGVKSYKHYIIDKKPTQNKYKLEILDLIY